MALQPRDERSESRSSESKSSWSNDITVGEANRICKKLEDILKENGGNLLATLLGQLFKQNWGKVFKQVAGIGLNDFLQQYPSVFRIKEVDTVTWVVYLRGYESPRDYRRRSRSRSPYSRKRERSRSPSRHRPDRRSRSPSKRPRSDRYEKDRDSSLSSSTSSSSRVEEKSHRRDHDSASRSAGRSSGVSRINSTTVDNATVPISLTQSDFADHISSAASELKDSIKEILQKCDSVATPQLPLCNPVSSNIEQNHIWKLGAIDVICQTFTDSALSDLFGNEFSEKREVYRIAFHSIFLQLQASRIGIVLSIGDKLLFHNAEQPSFRLPSPSNSNSSTGSPAPSCSPNSTSEIPCRYEEWIEYVKTRVVQSFKTGNLESNEDPFLSKITSELQSFLTEFLMIIKEEWCEVPNQIEFLRVANAMTGDNGYKSSFQSYQERKKSSNRKLQKIIELAIQCQLKSEDLKIQNSWLLKRSL